PALTDEQFKAVIRFVYLEKWPLTAEGLFKLIQKSPFPRESSLEEAFSMSSPFYALQLLFQKTEAPQDSSVLIRLASEGNWDLLSGLAREQMQMLDLSVDKRRRVLLSYLALKSATAAQLLVSTDFAFVLKKLDDQGLVDVLDLLTGELLEPFCLAILKSPRSDAVWERSVKRLSAHLGKPLAEPFQLSEAIALFVAAPLTKVPAQPQVAVEPVQSPSSWIMHTVQEGENLWKIARQYQVKVDEILKANELEKDKLYPGMTLRIAPK
ncbi:MAG: LysM peptidoglycan-binding domain-containing protein, partial [Chlamydiales bacterium]|nr:LysM peptidoglycan-binding domain-containing protein [Chlamydiales bacterium]